jgi:FAD:protein FMN transferase
MATASSLPTRSGRGSVLVAHETTADSFAERREISMPVNRVIPAALLIAVWGLAAAARQQTRIYLFHHEQVLGTSFDMKVIARSEAIADRADAAALAEIAREASVLSAYDSKSEFSRWYETTGVSRTVSPELFQVLSLFDQWRARTSGALDASAEAAGRLWKTAAALHRLPSEADIQAAVSSMRRTHWTLDWATRSATHLTDAPLVLNSFTKSFIIQRAADAALQASGARAVVVNIGGDLVVRGDWVETVQVADPRSDAENSPPLVRLSIANQAVATSGDYRRGVEIDGHHYSHIVDPRTGRPADGVVSATVVATDASTAGALATAFCVLTPGQSRAVAASVPGVEYLLVEKDGGRVQSPGWHALEPRPKPRAIGAAVPALYAAEQGAWNTAYELTIDLELARIEGFGGRRPYVAVWIEDKDRFPVRTLALWFQKPRWLSELKSWYRGDRMRAMAEGTDLTSTVSSATRPAGKYSLKWDGRDNQGKPVKAGTYTVCIEAAREHGTYQLIRQDMDFSGVPKQMDLQGNVEISSATLDYHRLGR